MSKYEADVEPRQYQVVQALETIKDGDEPRIKVISCLDYLDNIIRQTGRLQPNDQRTPLELQSVVYAVERGGSDFFRSLDNGQVRDGNFYQRALLQAWEDVQSIVDSYDEANQEAFRVLMAHGRAKGFDQFKGSLLDPVRSVGWNIVRYNGAMEYNPYQALMYIHAHAPTKVDLAHVVNGRIGQSRYELHAHFGVDLDDPTKMPAETCIRIGPSGLIDHSVETWFRLGDECTRRKPIYPDFAPSERLTFLG